MDPLKENHLAHMSKFTAAFTPAKFLDRYGGSGDEKMKKDAQLCADHLRSRLPDHLYRLFCGKPNDGDEVRGENRKDEMEHWHDRGWLPEIESILMQMRERANNHYWHWKHRFSLEDYAAEREGRSKKLLVAMRRVRKENIIQAILADGLGGTKSRLREIPKEKLIRKVVDDRGKHGSSDGAENMQALADEAIAAKCTADIDGVWGELLKVTVNSGVSTGYGRIYRFNYELPQPGLDK